MHIIIKVNVSRIKGDKIFAWLAQTGKHITVQRKGEQVLDFILAELFILCEYIYFSGKYQLLFFVFFFKTIFRQGKNIV